MSENGSPDKQSPGGGIHTVGVKAPTQTEDESPADRDAGGRRTLFEAAHKLGYFAPPTSSAAEERSATVRRRFDALADSERDVIAHAGRAVLALGALGVVYGDIGTSPLYTEQVIFTTP